MEFKNLKSQFVISS